MDRSHIYSDTGMDLLYGTLPDRLQHLAESTPEKEALIFYGVTGGRSTLTCVDLYHKSVLFAKGLMKIGVQKEDVVAICLPNVEEWLICHFGVIMAGGIALGFNFDRKDGKDVEHVLGKAGKCTTIIFKTDENDCEVLKLLAPSTDDKGKIANSKKNVLKFAIRCGGESEDFPLSYDNVLVIGKYNDDLALPIIDPDDVCLIFLSSGTTAFSKLVTWTHCRILSFCASTGNMLKIKEDDVFFNMMRFRGVGGYIFLYLYNGCTLIAVDHLPNAGTVQSMTEVIIKIINNEKCHYAHIVGPCLYELTSKRLHLGIHHQMEALLSGGYPLRHSIECVIGPVAKKFIYLYGLTETGFVSAKEINNTIELKDFNCGRPFPGFEIKVVGDDDNACSRNSIGTVHVRSRVAVPGYLNDNRGTNHALRRGAWFNTDDLGYISDDNEVYIMGRKNEIIHVGTRNVSPFKVESIIRSHPSVHTAAIVPVPDKVMHQQLCACIVLKEQSSATWSDILHLLGNHINATKESLLTHELIPKYHVFMNKLPTTANGKIVRKELIEEALKTLHLK